MRFPKHSLFRKLLKNLEYPLAAPSANISTRLSSVVASDVNEEFGSKIKYILNGGKCKIGLESTIINLLNKPIILRLGGLDISKIEKILKKKFQLKKIKKKKLHLVNFLYIILLEFHLRMNAKKPKKEEAFVLTKKEKKIIKIITI